MWNSPYSPSERGRRYRLEEISALTFPLAMFLDEVGTFPVQDVVCERILSALERDELVFALYQVLEALLEDVEIPEGGHTGIQEAILAELLTKAHAAVETEIEFEEGSFSARRAVWRSVERLVIQGRAPEDGFPGILADLGLSRDDPEPYRSEKLTSGIWKELILGECFSFGEFFLDTDWRMDFLMDLPPDQARAMSRLTGMDLDVVQALAHTPTEAESKVAEDYLSEVISRAEVADPP